jgi:hypothetical protein
VLQRAQSSQRRRQCIEVGEADLQPSQVDEMDQCCRELLDALALVGKRSVASVRYVKGRKQIPNSPADPNGCLVVHHWGPVRNGRKFLQRLVCDVAIFGAMVSPPLVYFP